MTAEWLETLTPEHYRVTRDAGTEQAFTGPYWRNKEAGTYACISCEPPLFTSDMNDDSDTGWPLFLPQFL